MVREEGRRERMGREWGLRKNERRVERNEDESVSDELGSEKEGKDSSVP